MEHTRPLLSFKKKKTSPIFHAETDMPRSSITSPYQHPFWWPETQMDRPSPPPKKSSTCDFDIHETNLCHKPRPRALAHVLITQQRTGSKTSLSS